MTHQTQWLQACDRVLVLRGGRVAADGHWKALQLSGQALPELSHVATELTLADLDETRSAEPADSSSTAAPEPTVALGSPVGSSLAGGSPTGGSGSAALRRGAAEASAYATAVATPRLGAAAPPHDSADGADKATSGVDEAASAADDTPTAEAAPEDPGVAAPVAAAASTPTADGAAGDKPVASHPVTLADLDVGSASSDDLPSEPVVDDEEDSDEAPTIALGPVGHALPSDAAAGGPGHMLDTSDSSSHEAGAGSRRAAHLELELVIAMLRVGAPVLHLL